MKADENYIPYGPEWVKEMSKFSKPMLTKIYGISPIDSNGVKRTKTEMIRELAKELKSKRP
jgi:hypothetical protein